MSFYTVSHWEANSWDPEDEVKAKEKYVPMIMSLGAVSVKMCKTDILKFMVITEWTDGDKAKEAAENIVSKYPDAVTLSVKKPIEIKNKKKFFGEHRSLLIGKQIYVRINES